MNIMRRHIICILGFPSISLYTYIVIIMTNNTINVLSNTKILKGRKRKGDSFFELKIKVKQHETYVFVYYYTYTHI